MIDMTNAAICLDCPGGAKIYPPEKLEQHKAVCHGDKDPATAICSVCGKSFVVTVPSRNCAKCRRNRGVKKKRFRIALVQKKHMIGTGIEKTETIRRVGRNG